MKSSFQQTSSAFISDTACCRCTLTPNVIRPRGSYCSWYFYICFLKVQLHKKVTRYISMLWWWYPSSVAGFRVWLSTVKKVPLTNKVLGWASGILLLGDSERNCLCVREWWFCECEKLGSILTNLFTQIFGRKVLAKSCGGQHRSNGFNFKYSYLMTDMSSTTCSFFKPITWNEIVRNTRFQ